MFQLARDTGRAIRSFRRDWRFSTTLVVTLATGIAATAVVFNVLNNTLLRPLPIRDESRIFRLLDWTPGPDGQPIRRSTRAHNFVALRDHLKTFDAVVGLRSVDLPLEGGAEPVQIAVALVSPGAFEMLGVAPVAGRLFTPAEEAAGADAAVLLVSHALWQQQLGARHDVIGRTLRLDGRPHTVVGVLAPGFRFPYQVEAWMPERVNPAIEASFATLARLAPGTTRAAAQQELDAIAATLQRDRPDSNRGLGFAMVPVREQLIGDQARVTWSLLATAALLLGLACANVANLLLARGTRRTLELAVHAAVGAAVGRQLRQLLLEALVASAAGTAVGLTIARPLSDAVMNLVPIPLRTQLQLGDITFDWRVGVFAAALAAITALVAGAAPAWRLARASPIDALRQRSRGSTGPRTLMQTLVAGEVALATMLLLAASLMVDNLSRLTSAPLGLTAEGLSTIEIALPQSRYREAPERRTLVRQLVAAAESVPGVLQAGVVTVNPLDRGSFGAAIETERRPLAPREPGFIVNNRLVTAGWFAAADVSLLSGRSFTDRDDERAPPVAIVSQRMARRLWPGINPIDQRIRLARPGSAWMTVVGVTDDVRDYGEWGETWYLPYAQHAATLAAGTIHLMLRSSLPPDVLGRAAQGVIHAIDPALPVPRPTAMTAVWHAALEQQRLAASASNIFAASGVLLAIIGTYGVLSYAVSARRRELGIRLALGAERRRVVLSVVRRGAVLAFAGLGAGLVLGMLLNRLLAGVATESPGVPFLSVVIVITVLGSFAIVATLLPAWRAARINAADVMRSE